MRGVTDAVAAMRVEASRCVVCNHVVVDAYQCDACAMSSSFVRRDDQPSITATHVGRVMGWRAGRETEHEQLMALVGIQENPPDENGKRLVTLRCANNNARFTRAELARWAEKLDELAPLPGETAAKCRALAKKSRDSAERRRWLVFEYTWTRIALVYMADVVAPRPPAKSRPRLTRAVVELP